MNQRFCGIEGETDVWESVNKKIIHLTENNIYFCIIHSLQRCSKTLFVFTVTMNRMTSYNLNK